MFFDCIFCVFFFFKQKTAYEMRISDWSSDVCSSDLLGADVGDAVAADRDVAAKGRGLAAIDGAAAQDQVGAAIGLRGPRRYHGAARGEKRDDRAACPQRTDHVRLPFFLT